MVQRAISKIHRIKKYFSYLHTNKKILGIVLYGSFATSKEHTKSDIDICIVAPHANHIELYKEILKDFPGDLTNLDIRFFEELPLLIRGDIIEEGIILYARNHGELMEYYFFSTRKALEEYRYRLKHIV
jgi:predicted nucleotidyltransferase